MADSGHSPHFSFKVTKRAAAGTLIGPFRWTLGKRSLERQLEADRIFASSGEVVIVQPDTDSGSVIDLGVESQHRALNLPVREKFNTLGPR